MLRNKLRYLIFLASAGLLTILYNEYYISIIFLTIFTLPFLLFGLMSYHYGKIRAELVPILYTANKFDKIPISIQVNNPTIFPISFVKIYITYKNAYSNQKFKKTICASMDSRTKTSVIFHLTSQYAGNMEITLEGIRVYDYIKLFSLKKKIKSELKVAVLPSYYELEDNEIINRSRQISESDNYSPNKKGDDPSEVFEIREYREGDRLQRVHWKLSSKLDQLMIKEFSDPVNCSILLFVNMSIPEGGNALFYTDAILECALTLSYSFMMKGQIHYLSWYDEKIGSCQRVCINTEKDLYEAVDGLMQAHPYKNTFDTMTAYLAEFPHEQYSDVFLITGEIYTPLIDSVYMLKACSRQVIYMRDASSFLATQIDEVALLQRSGEYGVDLRPVNIGNIRNDLIQLSAL